MQDALHGAGSGKTKRKTGERARRRGGEGVMATPMHNKRPIWLGRWHPPTAPIIPRSDSDSPPSTVTDHLPDNGHSDHDNIHQRPPEPG